MRHNTFWHTVKERQLSNDNDPGIYDCPMKTTASFLAQVARTKGFPVWRRWTKSSRLRRSTEQLEVEHQTALKRNRKAVDGFDLRDFPFACTQATQVEPKGIGVSSTPLRETRFAAVNKGSAQWAARKTYPRHARGSISRFGDPL